MYIYICYLYIPIYIYTLHILYRPINIIYNIYYTHIYIGYACVGYVIFLKDQTANA